MKIVILTFLFCISASLWSQTSVDSLPLEVEHRIASVQVEIQGSTWGWVLLRKTDIKVGTILKSREAFDQWLLEKIQLLNNQRVLESVQLDILELTPSEEGFVEVALGLKAKDSFNMIALPQPKYDDNTGFTLSIKARDYNFLGTMEPLRLTLEYQFDQDGNQSILLEQDMLIPFEVAGDQEAGWLFSQGLGLKYDKTPTYKMNNQFYFNGNWLGQNYRAWLGQGLYLFEELEDKSVPDWYYLRSEVGVSTAFPLVEMGTMGFVSWNPSLSAQWSYRFDAPVHPLRDQPYLQLGNSLNLGRLDWKQNLRQGLVFQINQVNQWKILNGSYDRWIEAMVTQGTSWGWGGLTTRFLGFWSWDSYRSNQGAALRGIIDNRIESDLGFSVNIDLPVQVWVAMPSQWFNVSELRIFDFELHLSPITDFGLFRNWKSGQWMEPYWSGGIEVFVFPLFFRAFYLRASVAWDIPELYQTGNLSGVSSRDGAPIREIYIGIGHHY